MLIRETKPTQATAVRDAIQRENPWIAAAAKTSTLQREGKLRSRQDDGVEGAEIILVRWPSH